MNRFSNEAIASYVSQRALAAAGQSQPYGGPEWIQAEGYPIREAMERQTEYEVLRTLREQEMLTDGGLRRRKIEFDERWVEPILAGEKTATIRYGDDAAGLEAGQPVDLETEGGDQILSTEIVGVVTDVPLQRAPAAIRALQASYPIKPVADLVECLDPYYSDPITPDSRVHIPAWPDPTTDGGGRRV